MCSHKGGETHAVAIHRDRVKLTANSKQQRLFHKTDPKNKRNKQEYQTISDENGNINLV